MPPEIIVKRFHLEEDLPVVNEWLREREHKELEPRNVPAIGFIAFDVDEPVACIFLRRAEGAMAIIDGMASNPAVPGPVRHLALDAVVSRVLQEAREREITDVIAWSIDNGTLMRSRRHGFEQTPYSLIIKDMRSGPLVN